MRLFRLCLFFVALAVSAHASAQGLPFGSLSGDPLPTTIQLENFGPALWTERDSENVGQTRADLNVPFVQSDVDAYAVQIRATRLLLDRDHMTPSGVAIPKDLGSVAIGPFARRKLESGDILAGDIQFGRAGIQLGSSETATTVSANLFWARKKDDEEGQWIYLLSYSNSRSSFNNIPFPGFAYVKSFKAEGSQGMWAAGAPFFFAMIRGQPWSFNALLTPFTAHVETGYSLMGPFVLFARYGWHPQGFKVANGPSERIVFEEFRTVLGARGPITRGTMLSLGVAYSDGRRVAWSDSVLRSSENQSRLDDAISVFLGVSGRF